MLKVAWCFVVLVFVASSVVAHEAATSAETEGDWYVISKYWENDGTFIILEKFSKKFSDCSGYLISVGITDLVAKSYATCLTSSSTCDGSGHTVECHEGTDISDVFQSSHILVNFCDIVQEKGHG